MKTNRTTNQLGLAPIRMPKTRRSWIDGPVPSIRCGSWQEGVVGPACVARWLTGVWRAMIASASTPGGSVPYCRPPSPARREAQNASATAAGAWRTSSEPCRASAIRSTTRRARGSIDSTSANSSRSAATERVEAGVGAGRLVELVEERREAPAGERLSARRTSSAMTLPEPSQIDASGISRYRRGMPDSST